MSKKRKPQQRKSLHHPTKLGPQLTRAAYALKHNKFTLSHLHDFFTAFGHVFYIQALSKDRGWNLAKLEYLNQVKPAFYRIFNKVVVMALAGYPADAVISLHHMTRGKIVWFISRFYEPAMEFVHHYETTAAKNAKIKAIAACTMWVTTQLKAPRLLQFMTQPSESDWECYKRNL